MDEIILSPLDLRLIWPELTIGNGVTLNVKNNTYLSDGITISGTGILNISENSIIRIL